jgi:hypothetical protein
MAKRHKNRPVYIILFLYLLLGAVLITTNPRSLPLALLVAPFVILATALYLTISLILRMMWPRLSRPKRLFYSACLAGLPTFLLILNSVNQLTWRDVLLVVILTLFLFFYGSRWQASQK